MDNDDFTTQLRWLYGTCIASQLRCQGFPLAEALKTMNLERLGELETVTLPHLCNSRTQHGCELVLHWTSEKTEALL